MLCKLIDLLNDRVTDRVNLLRATGNSFKIVTEDGKEFFLDDAGLLDIFQNACHMLGLGKDISDSREVPTCDGCLAFNVHFGLEELVYPLFEALDTLVDILNCFIGLFLEDCAEINLIADLLADFC